MSEAGYLLNCFYEEAAGVAKRAAMENFGAVVS